MAAVSADTPLSQDLPVQLQPVAVSTARANGLVQVSQDEHQNQHQNQHQEFEEF